MAAAILFGALFTVAVSMTLGFLLLGRAADDWGLRFAVGGALLSLAVFCLCAAHLARPAVFAVMGAGVLLAGGWPRNHIKRPHITPAQKALAAAFGVYLILYLCNSMAPEISFDGVRYHLGLVGSYLREHGFHPITNDLYASLSQGVEMLYLYAYAFGRHSAASMVHCAFLIALAWLMFSYARRAGFAAAGACASLLLFASPLVGADGTSTYIDVAVAAIAFALFYVLQLWDERREIRLLIAAGLLAGFAYAAKYTAWVAVPYALGFVAWKARRLRPVLLAGLCAAAMIAPWMVKNIVFAGNPVAPFYNNIFPNQYVTAAFEREYRQNLARYNLPSRWEIPVQVTVRGAALGGMLGPVFLLAPLALLSLKRREGRQLLLAAAIFGANYFGNIGTRFLIPVVPFVALAMAIAAAGWPRASMAITLIHAVISWPSVVRRYAAPDAWHPAKVLYREALRIKPEDGFLQSNLPDYGIDRMIDRVTRPGSSVFTFTPIPEAYTTRTILVAYQSAANIASRAILYSGFLPEYAPTRRLRFAFERRTLDAVRVVQSEMRNDQWRIHKLRVFDGARELSPSRDWRATAQPYPWGASNLLDGNPVTFWECGDTARPGQYVEVDFGRTVQADSVVLLMEPNQGMGLRLLVRSPQGNWVPSTSSAEVTDTPAAQWFRRAAAEELKRRGIDYLLLFDREEGAGDLCRNAALWGVREAGRYGGATLWELP